MPQTQKPSRFGSPSSHQSQSRRQSLRRPFRWIQACFVTLVGGEPGGTPRGGGW
jgi:hypothetical protein